MPRGNPPDDEKTAALRAQHALNSRPQSVTDPTFVAGAPFLDARDLVQIKYEMLRRVGVDRRGGRSEARTRGNWSGELPLGLAIACHG